MVRIAAIEPGSIGEELELQVGTRIIRINGERVRDGIDLTFLLAESELEIEAVDPDGETSLIEILREPGERLGLIPAPDTVRECANECVFCFIDGNPPGVRPSLWVRDDDFRLSFTYGSYVTLTNLGPRGLQRLVDQRLSPLYVSVHATEPEVRVALLKNSRSGEIMDQLRFLTGAGLEVHTQVVLCPEWNDGVHLDRTIEDLYALGSGIRTLSVVPVGLTQYNLNRPVRLLTGPEAGQALEQVDAIRALARRERGYSWAYAADELYLSAGREVPEIDYYDDMALTENGVGAVRVALSAFEKGLPRLPRLDGRSVRILTGHSMAPYFREMLEALREATGAEVEVVSVANRFYGPSVTVAGLLAGEDLAAAVVDPRPGELILIPAEALNQDDLFVDSLPLTELRRRLAPAEVVAGHEITALLASV